MLVPIVTDESVTPLDDHRFGRSRVGGALQSVKSFVGALPLFVPGTTFSIRHSQKPIGIVPMGFAVNPLMPGLWRTNSQRWAVLD
jgi:hypothetical protein